MQTPMAVELEIILTRDGSHSLLHRALNEPYHSRHGALSESHHVYITHGLLPLIGQTPPCIKILEVGFGTGLNLYLTARQARQNPGIQFEVQTLEPFPLSWDLVSGLNFFQDPESTGLARQLHEADWEKPVRVLENFRLTKRAVSLQQAALPARYFQLIYFDAFAPTKQPELWKPELLAAMGRALIPGGTWVTYCAKGQLKRDLRAAGFSVEALPGPPGKREMLRATWR